LSALAERLLLQATEAWAVDHRIQSRFSRNTGSAIIRSTPAMVNTQEDTEDREPIGETDSAQQPEGAPADEAGAASEKSDEPAAEPDAGTGTVPEEPKKLPADGL